MTLSKKELKNNNSGNSSPFLLKGDELLNIIPQRDPIVMVDTLFEVSESTATTGLTVNKSTYFVINEELKEAGIIEHMAQSSAAFAGYEAYCKGLPAQLGFIGEVKKFKLTRLPRVGETLITRLTKVANVMGVTIMTAQTFSNSELIAQTEMKIFLKD